MSRNRNKSLITTKGGDPLDISHFFQSIGDKIGGVLGLNPLLENILVMKVAIILIAISLVISSWAILFLAISQHRFKKSIELLKSYSSPTTLPRMTDQTK